MNNMNNILVISYFIFWWMVGFFCGYAFSSGKDKYVFYGFLCYFIGLIIFLIRVAIYNPIISFSGISSSEWATTILFMIIFYTSSIGSGYLIGKRVK